MNPWKAVSEPNQATPTKSTLPAHRLLAASTEGASLLQVVQVGAQNQRATVWPVNCVKSSWPPPTSGAVNCNTSGVAAPAATVAEGELSADGDALD